MIASVTEMFAEATAQLGSVNPEETSSEFDYTVGSEWWQLRSSGRRSSQRGFRRG